MLRCMLTLVVLLLLSGAALAREYIWIVGSSTVYPFTTVVAEQFGKTTKFRTPKVESTGSGGGLKLFCSGIGFNYPDMANSSRRIKQSEINKCNDNGIENITELKIGYDGIVLVRSRKGEGLSLTRREVFLALAKMIPVGGGIKLNPYKSWAEVNPNLSDFRIRVLGPPPTSGTRDSFVELVMEKGCKKFPVVVKSVDWKRVCHSMREDGAFVEAGENDNLIIQKLLSDTNSLGILGFGFLDQNLDKLRGMSIRGIVPTFDTISDGSYPISRPLYLYIKKAHVGFVKGIKEFLNEYTKDRSWGDDGYLSDRGLIPLPVFERRKFALDVENLKTMIM